MRITGLASGLDMDEIIKNSMKPYRIKIDKKGQDKEVLEIKQKLYREVIKDSRELYNKYFDATNKESLILSKSWTTAKFTSSNDNIVSVTGSSDAKAETYTITGKSAKANQIAINTGINKDDKLVVNGQEFILKGDTAKERATNLNNDLKSKGINVSVKYTDFAGTSGANQSGFVFESTILGKENNFTIGGGFTDNIGTVEQGKDATASTITNANFTVDNLKLAGGKIKLGNSTEIQMSLEKLSNSDIEKLLQEKLKNLKLTAKVEADGKIEFKTTELGDGVKDPEISIGIDKGTFTKGENATFTKNTLDFSELSGKKVSINGNLVDLTGKTTEKEVADHINKVLGNKGFKADGDVGSDKIVLTSTIAGASQKINVNVVKEPVGNPGESGYVEAAKFATGGQDAEIQIKNSKGGIFKHTGLSNTVTLDGVTFKFNGDIPDDSKITINGKQDVTETKEKLVKFINDYNTFMEKLNTLTSEKRNKSFMPLTEEQKKEMSESEVKLWNEKVQKGQLSRDNDITRIANSMKESMRTLVDGSGLTLEKIGIRPVADYQGTKNGTFTIDENTLTKALEENSEEVMNLFVKAKPSDNSPSNEKYLKTGLAQRLKDILYNETVTITSAILKKAGIEGSSTVANNELSKSIEKYEQKMKDMETDFSRREQALYTKFSKLETIMNKYNSQQSYLTQQLGMG